MQNLILIDVFLIVLDDFKAVTHLLVAKAKEQGSGDNISVIVVFLKEPRDIAADNASLPMELG